MTRRTTTSLRKFTNSALLSNNLNLAAHSAIVILTISLAMAVQPAISQNVIAHWSFDAATITTDPGDGHILTAADDTGNHNATSVINGTGSTINSAAGVFGEAAAFTNGTGGQATNNASFSFPQLTELAGPTGGDFTVSAWLKTTNTSSTSPILVDWGNAPTNTNRFTYWFTTNISNGNALQRGQFRSRNDLNDGVNETNTDVVARQVGGNIADDQWHHLAWTWDKSAATFRSYQDGVLLETFVSSADLVDLLVSDSVVGALARKADNNQYLSGSIDEVWVLEGAYGLSAIRLLGSTNAVPEPGTIVLTVLASAMGIGCCRRRSA